MTENLQLLARILVAMLVTGVVVVSMASAQQFRSEKSPATLTGVQETGPKGELTRFAAGGLVECKKVTYGGVMNASPSTTISLVPIFDECTYFGFPSTVAAHGCQFVIHAPLFAFGERMDIVCGAGKDMTVTFPSTGIVKCIVHIPSQDDLLAVSVSNIGAGPTREATIQTTVTGELEFSQTEGTGLGKCTTALNTTTGSYSSRAVVTGENLGGSEHVGLFVE
jgi:hypothetical protein